MAASQRGQAERNADGSPATRTEPNSRQPRTPPPTRALGHPGGFVMPQGGSMSKETLHHFNTQTLIGNTEHRGTAWHYRAEHQGEEPTTTPSEVPQGVRSARATIGVVTVPMCSMLTSATSPGPKKRGGVSAAPTPLGVPVAITSPGSRVTVSVM